MSTAEAFVADAKSRSDISDEEKALQARRHSRDTVDIVAGKHGTDFASYKSLRAVGERPLCKTERKGRKILE